MNSQKSILAVLAGTVVYFLLGWLIYGVLLRQMMEAGMAKDVMRPDSEMILWAMIAGHLVYVSLLHWLLVKTGTTNVRAAATFGLVLGVLMSLSYNLASYAVSTLVVSRKLMAADVLAAALMTAVTASVVAWVYNYHRKTIAVA